VVVLLLLVVSLLLLVVVSLLLVVVSLLLVVLLILLLLLLLPISSVASASSAILLRILLLSISSLRRHAGVRLLSIPVPSSSKSSRWRYSSCIPSSSSSCLLLRARHECARVWVEGCGVWVECECVRVVRLLLLLLRVVLPGVGRVAVHGRLTDCLACLLLR